MEDDIYIKKFNDANKNLKLSGYYSSDQKKELILTFFGEITLYNSDSLYNAIKSTIDSVHSITSLIFDFSETSYIASTGIGFLLEIKKYCDLKSISLYLMKLNDKIKTIFSLLGFNKYFSLIDDINKDKGFQ